MLLHFSMAPMQLQTNLNFDMGKKKKANGGFAARRQLESFVRDVH